MLKQVISSIAVISFCILNCLGQVNSTSINSSTFNDCAVWDFCPNPNIVITDTVFIKHDIVSSANITVNGVLYIDVRGNYSGGHKINVATTGKLYNYGRIEITEELHNDGEVYNSGYLGIKKYHDDGYTCNYDTIEIQQGQKYDCHGCTLECGGTLLACDVKLHNNGGNPALISEVDVCCQDGSDPSINLQSGSIDSATVNFCSLPLPIELLYFAAKVEEKTVVLDWQTLAELNNKEFVIWKSIDGLKFNSIGSVPGSGSVSTNRKYRYVDANLAEGLSYYRISQVDFNGKETFYSIATVSSESFHLVNSYPNPVQDDLIIQLSSVGLTPIQVDICNVVGQVLVKRQFRIVQGENKLSIPTNSFNNGVYFFRISMPNGEFILKKFLKQ